MPFYQNRAASNPSLAPAPAPAPRGGSGLSVADQPFNYIAFSQQLYGDKSPDKNLTVKTLDKPKQRTISYVWNKTKNNSHELNKCYNQDTQEGDITQSSQVLIIL